MFAGALAAGAGAGMLGLVQVYSSEERLVAAGFVCSPEDLFVTEHLFPAEGVGDIAGAFERGSVGSERLEGVRIPVHCICTRCKSLGVERFKRLSCKRSDIKFPISNQSSSNSSSSSGTIKPRATIAFSEAICSALFLLKSSAVAIF